MRDSWRHFVAEFIGTFALVFVGGAAIMIARDTNSPAGLLGIAFAHGLIHQSGNFFVKCFFCLFETDTFHQFTFCDNKAGVEVAKHIGINVRKQFFLFYQPLEQPR